MQIETKIQILANYLSESGLYKESRAVIGLYKFAKNPCDGAVEYAIQEGDSALELVAKKHGIPVSMIMDCNPGLDPNSMVPGRTKVMIPLKPDALNSNVNPSTELKAWMKAEEGWQRYSPTVVCKDGSRHRGSCGDPYLCTYDDGKGNTTIGWGHKQLSERSGDAKITLTKEECETWLTRDLDSAASHLVNSLELDTGEFLLIPVALNAHQADALISLIFNAGQDKYRKSSLHQDYISKGKVSGTEFESAFNSFAIGSDAGLPGRRARELKMFKGTYEKKCG
jgi:GH24 family phage-related lysozyme (muramidase)